MPAERSTVAVVTVLWIYTVAVAGKSPSKSSPLMRLMLILLMMWRNCMATGSRLAVSPVAEA